VVVDATNVASSLSTRIDFGTIIAGRFRITGLIGGGGMAVVYAAHDEAYDRPAAVKVMQARLARSDEFRERFEREAQLANLTFNPHVLPVWDHGEDRGVFTSPLRWPTPTSLASSTTKNPMEASPPVALRGSSSRSRGRWMPPTSAASFTAT
jgi:serine/threonine-protein kinase